MSKPTIILVTKNLPPDIGGMETLWFNAIKEVSKLCNLHVVGPSASRKFISEYCEFHPTPKFLPLQLLFALIKITLLSIRLKPNYILSGSGLTLLPTVLSGKIAKVKSAVYLHGLDIIYPNKLYQALFKKMIRQTNHTFANSSNTARLAINAGAKADLMTVLHPCVTPLKRPKNIDENFRMDGEKINLIYFGRVIPRKGLLEFIKRCMPDLLHIKPNIHLHIVGDNPKNTHNSYFKEVLDTLKASSIKGNFTLWGTVSEEHLAQLVSQCNAHIFPLLDMETDVEGFGIVILEADSLGVPTIAFNCGGAEDAVQMSNYGELVAPGDYTAFTNQLMATITKKPKQARAETDDNAKQWHHFATKLISYLLADMAN